MNDVGTAGSTITRLSRTDTAAVLAEVMVPLVARGAIKRRPRVVGALERFDADRRAVERLRRIRTRYGDGPVLLAVPKRNIGFVLTSPDATRLLEMTPTPFSPATFEKRRALSHFQPHGVLISEGDERARLRRLNEVALAENGPSPTLSTAVVAAERFIRPLTDRDDPLGWDDFRSAWWSLVLEVVFGPDASDDLELIDELERLRSAANWAYLRPRRVRRRTDVLARIGRHRRNAPPSALAARLDEAGREDDHLDDQIAHWLFAFDAAAITTFRALAVAASAPAAGSGASSQAGPLPHGARAWLLETLRLWPTTPVILREQLDETAMWRNGETVSGTSLTVYAPLFHRDVADPDEFRPERWNDATSRLDDDETLVPFSGGPAICPGRDVALDVASAALDQLVGSGRTMTPGPEPVVAPMPSILDPFSRTVAYTTP